MEKTSYIVAFNKKFATTIGSISNEYSAALLKEMNKYSDYYSAADSLGFKYGVEIGIKQIEDKNGDVSSFVPVIRYKGKSSKDNPIFEQKLCSPIKSINSCYTILAKEWLYAILKDEDFIKGNPFI